MNKEDMVVGKSYVVVTTDDTKVAQETVVISLAEYNKLARDSEFLSCLRNAGVDNWGGYSDAQEAMDEGDEDE